MRNSRGVVRAYALLSVEYWDFGEPGVVDVIHGMRRREDCPTILTTCAFFDHWPLQKVTGFPPRWPKTT